MDIIQAQATTSPLGSYQSHNSNMSLLNNNTTLLDKQKQIVYSQLYGENMPATPDGALHRSIGNQPSFAFQSGSNGAASHSKIL